LLWIQLYAVEDRQQERLESTAFVEAHLVGHVAEHRPHLGIGACGGDFLRVGDGKILPQRLDGCGNELWRLLGPSRGFD
jgi:hypothetical protein